VNKNMIVEALIAKLKPKSDFRSELQQQAVSKYRYLPSYAYFPVGRHHHFQ
jgi:hypothetical protein